MANIGATTAFYKVETSLTRANNEVSKSMERLATGKQNANAGDRSSYVAMSDTFRLDYVGTKAGIKSASVAMGYLETGMRVLDAASSLLSRLQELAVLGANNTNTVEDNEAINLEAEAIADEFNRLMTTSTYKGKNVFVDSAGNQEIAMGGRGSEMTFGIGSVSYGDLYASTARTIDGEPNNAEGFNLAHLPSDAIVSKGYGNAATQGNPEAGTVSLEANKKYVIRNVTSTAETDTTDTANDPSAKSVDTARAAGSLTLTEADGSAVSSAGTLASGMVLDVSTASTIARSNGSEGIRTVGTFVDIDGAISTFAASAGETDGARKAGNYTGVTYIVTDSGGSTYTNTSAAFDVTVDTDGKATATMTDAGQDFENGSKIKVVDGQLGGLGAADFVFDVSAISDLGNRGTNTSYTITSDDYTVFASDGTTVQTGATGATFTVTTTSSGAATVTVEDSGDGFTATDLVVIDGAAFTGGSGLASDLKFTVSAVADNATSTAVRFAEVLTGENAFKANETYVIQSLGSVNSDGLISRSDSDANIISKAFTDVNGNALTGNLSVGQKIKFATLNSTIGSTTVTQQHLDAANALIEGMTFTMSSDTLTSDIEAIQNLINRARVEAGSQYAAIESAVSYTTDLTAQYELGYNAVNDVNFSAETAHLAKNQILQQAATAMLAQANSGQQGLLQLIQG